MWFNPPEALQGDTYCDGQRVTIIAEYENHPGRWSYRETTHDAIKGSQDLDFRIIIISTLQFPSEEWCVWFYSPWNPWTFCKCTTLHLNLWHAETITSRRTLSTCLHIHSLSLQDQVLNYAPGRASPVPRAIVGHHLGNYQGGLRQYCVAERTILIRTNTQ